MTIILSLSVLWIFIGIIFQTFQGVVAGLLFGYQYSSSLRDYAELFFVMLVAFVVWPIGGNNSVNFIGWVGKTLHFQHY